MRALSLSLLLTTLLVTLNTAGVNWGAYDDIRTGRFAMVTAGNFNSSSTPITYNITYTNPISQTLSSGLGIVGFYTSKSNYFSVNVSITNFAKSNMVITAYALDDTIIYDLSINYIAVGTNAYFIDVQSACFLPSIINSKNDSRSQYRSGTTIFVNQPVQCNVYLSGFRVYNSMGLVNTLSAQVSCNDSSSYLNYTFSATENNTVSLVCYTTIIFCDICTKYNYYEWGQIGQDIVSSGINASTIAISTTDPQYRVSGSDGNDRTFWGINSLNVSRGDTRLFNFQSDYYVGNQATGPGFKYLAQPGTNNMTLAHFFIANRSCDQSSSSNDKWFQIVGTTLTCQQNCNSNTYQTLPNSAKYCAVCHYTCQTYQCDGALAVNCTACNSTNSRTHVSSNHTCPCNSGFLDVGVPVCVQCSSLIIGCDTCVSKTICTLCISGFYILAGTCQCTTGFLAGKTCTTIYGCTQAVNVGTTTYCQICNATLFYLLDSTNRVCVCMTGYYMDVYGNCVGKCGDSILASGQECDDGNTINDDGCSSTCKAEANITCINNPMPSNCVWNYNISGSVAYVRRILDKNAVQIALKLSPQNTFYKSLDWAFHLENDMPCINGGPSLSHDGTYLLIYCEYNQSIEGNTFNFTLQMDTFYYLNSSHLYATIPALGMNAKLTYDNNYGMNNIQNILVMLVSILAILILFISTISERMIGVQCIQTFQSVLYGMTCMYIAPSSIAPLQNLRYSNGYNYIFGTDYERLYKYDFIIGEVGLQSEFLMSFNLSYIILFIIILTILLLKAIMLKFQSDKKNEESEYNRQFSMQQIHPNYQNVKKAYKIVFERIYFVAAFWCMFLVFFALVIQYTLEKEPTFVISNRINGLLSILAVVIILSFLTMVIINGLYPKLRIFPMFMDPKYPVYYTIYNTLYIIIIISFYRQSGLPYVLASLTAVNIVVLAIWRPYPQNIHNVGILLNQVTIILAIGLYVYQEFTAPLENNQSLFTIGFFAIWFLLLAVDILSTIRLYKYWRYMKDHNLSYNDPGEKDDKDEEKALVTPNTKQNDANLNQTAKGFDTKKKTSSNTKNAVSSLFKPYQDNYYQDVKQNSNKIPLNSGKDTQRLNRSKIELNQEDYDTFSKKKQGNSFYITPIDPNAKEVPRNEVIPPYDQFGNVKVHNKTDGEEYDALKAIKARLRKDFYQKVHGVDYVPPKQDNKAENDLSNEPQNFEPSDQNDEE